MTAEKRQEIKSELTSAPEDAASEEQVATLKAELKKLMELDAEQESFVQNVAVKTEGFTKITASVRPVHYRCHGICSRRLTLRMG